MKLQLETLSITMDTSGQATLQYCKTARITSVVERTMIVRITVRSWVSAQLIPRVSDIVPHPPLFNRSGRVELARNSIHLRGLCGRSTRS